MDLCPCGSGLAFDQCCGPYLDGKLAPTAEAVMRSRYTAYVVGNLDHLERTCTANALKEFDRADIERFMVDAKWLGLDILNVENGGPDDETGQVDFTFHYRHKGENYSQRELASFCKKDGAWLYQDSDVNGKGKPVQVTQIGRNDPCPCGSGKKYKKCCGA